MYPVILQVLSKHHGGCISLIIAMNAFFYNIIHIYIYYYCRFTYTCIYAKKQSYTYVYVYHMWIYLYAYINMYINSSCLSSWWAAPFVRSQGQLRVPRPPWYHPSRKLSTSEPWGTPKDAWSNGHWRWRYLKKKRIYRELFEGFSEFSGFPHLLFVGKSAVFCRKVYWTNQVDLQQYICKTMVPKENHWPMVNVQCFCQFTYCRV